MALSSADQRFRQAVLGFYAWIAALLVATLVPFVAQSLVSRDNPGIRAAGVAIGVAAWIPIVLVVLRIIRAGDEYQRRLHITAGAVAFLMAFGVLLGWSWLVEAGFAPYPSLQVVWITVAMCWAVSVFAVKIHFERRS